MIKGTVAIGKSYTINTPVGMIELRCDDAETAIIGVNFVHDDHDEPPTSGTFPHIIEQTRDELMEYFQGQRTTFDIPVDYSAQPYSDFYKRVWNALLTIPYGETRTYADIARQIGSPKACRAVGGANHNNPISIIVPCHRVIGSTGKLTGYAGGLEKKTFLLDLEKRANKLF